MPSPGALQEQRGATPRDRWVRRTANLASEVSTMARNDSPIGSSVEDHISQRRARSAKYRETQDRLRPFEEIARVVMMRRAQLGLTQQELADRMGSTKSVISRIESGQHRTSTDTLRRLAEALDGHAVIGFEFDSDQQLRPDLVRL
jgi:ribosome-binding protein aMBF1 (putative translation factor)